jgi:hypothetical protein
MTRMDAKDLNAELDAGEEILRTAINGMRKPHRTTFTDRDYRKHVRTLGENHLANVPRRLAA